MSFITGIRRGGNITWLQYGKFVDIKGDYFRDPRTEWHCSFCSTRGAVKADGKYFNPETALQWLKYSIVDEENGPNGMTPAEYLTSDKVVFCIKTNKIVVEEKGVGASGRVIRLPGSQAIVGYKKVEDHRGLVNYEMETKYSRNTMVLRGELRFDTQAEAESFNFRVLQGKGIIYLVNKDDVYALEKEPGISSMDGY